MYSAEQKKLVFPAWAGVILEELREAKLVLGVPRMGGGDPSPEKIMARAYRCSPHGRG